MTQPSRTTESISRDNGAIREIMHQIRELTVPDRATLAVGLIGHLATMMNRRQMLKLLDELREEAVRVQDVPPSRRADLPAEGSEPADPGRDQPAGGHERGGQREVDGAYRGVGQAGRGEIRPGDPV